MGAFNFNIVIAVYATRFPFHQALFVALVFRPPTPLPLPTLFRALLRCSAEQAKGPRAALNHGAPPTLQVASISTLAHGGAQPRGPAQVNACGALSHALVGSVTALLTAVVAFRAERAARHQFMG